MRVNYRKEIIITQYKQKPLLMYQIDNKPYDLFVGDDIQEDKLAVGDIYVGRVQNIVQNINAAFIEVKKGVVCYLPMSECGQHKLHMGDDLVVQVKKSAVKTKQAVVTKNIELVGTYCVVSLYDTKKAISKKITDQEKREQLQYLLSKFEGNDYGIVIRTNAEQADLDLIYAECQKITSELKEMIRYSKYKTCFTCLRKADPFYLSFIRDCRPEEYDRIVTDDEKTFEELTERNVEKLEQYNDDNYPLQKLIGLETKIEKALAKRVWLKSGGNLVIEPTEALTVIDVNTGKAIDGRRNKETTFFKINCEAAREVARQMRLRSMSGIILVDFIDMQKKEHRQDLMELLQEELKRDKTRTALVDITKLGLVEITRMKKNPPLWEMI